MKKYVLILLALTLAVSITGCGKKEMASDTMSESMLTEPMSQATSEIPVMPETKAEVVPPAPVAPAAPVAQTLTTPSIAKPTPQDIQAALKNAGFYSGSVDGKIGPMTKKAIEEFQKANGLTVDGKVGPRTWSLLSTHLMAAVKGQLQ